MAAIIAGQNLQKKSTSKFPTQYSAANTTATMIMHPIQIPTMAPVDKPPLSMSACFVVSTSPQFGSSSANNKIKGVSTGLQEQCARRAPDGYHLDATHCIVTKCYSYNWNPLTRTCFSRIPRYPSLPSLPSPFSLSVVSKLFIIPSYFSHLPWELEMVEF